MSAGTKYSQHPSGVDCIAIVEHMPFNVGRAIQLLWGLEATNGTLAPDDVLERAGWYIERERARLRNLVDIAQADLKATALAAAQQENELQRKRLDSLAGGEKWSVEQLDEMARRGGSTIRSEILFTIEMNVEGRPSYYRAPEDDAGSLWTFDLDNAARWVDRETAQQYATNIPEWANEAIYVRQRSFLSTTNKSVPLTMKHTDIRA